MKRLYKANNRTAPGATKGMLNAIMDFKEWVEHLLLLEQDLQASCTRWVSCAIKAANTLRDSLAANIDNTTTVSTAAPNTPYTTPLKPLTNNNKTPLRQHLRCYKCRMFYAGHLGQNCTNLHPTLKDCKQVTAANTAKAKAAYDKIQAASHMAMTTIATIFEADAIFEESESNKDSEDYVDAKEVEEYIHLSFALPQHLHWMCCIDAPATCAPTPVNTLIDHRSSPVLISSELTDILCLTARPLFKPLSVSGVFTKKNDTMTPLVLTQYCRLSIQSPDALWHSHIINAIICPELHTNLTLGLDFLMKNKIVVDAELWTVVAKESGYDLLNPPNPKLHQCPITRSPAQCHKLEVQQIKAGQNNARKTRLLVHMELMALFDENPGHFDMTASTTGLLDLITTIKTQIVQLAGEATLRKLDKQMKESFVNCFPSNIPHVMDLPRDIYHHIKLLPGTPVSVSHAYGCPRKYHAGWKMLINQHVAAGWI